MLLLPVVLSLYIPLANAEQKTIVNEEISQQILTSPIVSATFQQANEEVKGQCSGHNDINTKSASGGGTATEFNILYVCKNKTSGHIVSAHIQGFLRIFENGERIFNIDYLTLKPR
jgi:hypothetical protein